MSQSQGMNNRAALKPFRAAVSRYFRSVMVLKAMSYQQLSDALAQRGVELTPENLRNKVSRGLIPVDLFILLLEILGETDAAVAAIAALSQNIDA